MCFWISILISLCFLCYHYLVITYALPGHYLSPIIFGSIKICFEKFENFEKIRVLVAKIYHSNSHFSHFSHAFFA